MTRLIPRKPDSETPVASKRSRSSALMPLTWQLGILVAGTVGAASVDAPEWLLISLAALVGASTVATWRAYFRLLRTDPDALRSGELQRPAIAADDQSPGGAITGEQTSGPDSPAKLPAGDT
jgi:hypothetical protein